jgi:dUTP pyrophosphatase
MNISISQLPHGQDLPLPSYGTDMSAGLDLYAALEMPIILNPTEYKLIPTGIQIALQPGTEGQIRARSGLALKHGIGVLNAPGTIDADYRGEIKIILINHGKEPFQIDHGMRIAQLVVAPFIKINWDLQESLETIQASERGVGGFGSTGIR